MKISYRPNPLRTIVEVDPHDRQLMVLRLQVEHLEDLLTGVQIRLQEGHTLFSVEAARQEAARVDHHEMWAAETVGQLILALQDEHEGDCTCTPCSCLKCHAEELLGIRTIAGLGKHRAYQIRAAFTGEEDSREGLTRALAKLDNYAPIRQGGWLDRPAEEWEAHLPRWREEAQEAASWLRGYRDVHFARKWGGR